MADKNDLEIARRATPLRIQQVAEKLGIGEEHIEPYGHYKGKISLPFIASLGSRPSGRLILVTAMSPTPAGEGKTTTSVGLADGLSRIGERALVCLREPSLGPVFGMKGGAAGGGYAQVVPMEDINLHFTGDFAAIALANNLLAALIDNHIHHGNALGLDVRRVTWRRVVDMNDRALRKIVVGLGGTGNGIPREDGFDIVVASEVMAILCLATSLADLKTRLGNIIIGYTHDDRPVRARELQADGAMAILLKEALKPNLVQTLEHTPAILHGGPFANIAHGCNSVLATQTALKLADYVVTEAGFGADLGAEKFLDIKCRASGLWPAAAVLVATVRALKYHGGMPLSELGSESVERVKAGLANLERHAGNLREHFGLPCVVAINHFSGDSAAELECVERAFANRGMPVVVTRHWAEGGRGAEVLARSVVQAARESRATPQFSYPNEMPLLKKIESVATKVYGAVGVVAEERVRGQLERLEGLGFGDLPVCIAKTQYSFSDNPKLLGAPTGHSLRIREVRLAAGAKFVVAICGDIMTMPGLPKLPASARMTIGDDGVIEGLS